MAYQPNCICIHCVGVKWTFRHWFISVFILIFCSFIFPLKMSSKNLKFIYFPSKFHRKISNLLFSLRFSSKILKFISIWQMTMFKSYPTHWFSSCWLSNSVYYLMPMLFPFSFFFLLFFLIKLEKIIFFNVCLANLIRF